jgi:hypothetical protein
MIERFTARIELARVTGHYAAHTGPMSSPPTSAASSAISARLQPLPVRSSN